MALKYTQHTVMGINCPVLQGGHINSEEAIVFIHGFPGNADHWRPFMENLAGLSRVVALNMPGFGEADKPKNFNYTVEAYLPILTSLFEKLGINKIHLVLHDFGGVWGMNWAAKNIEQIKSVSLINTGLFLEKWHSLANLYRTPILGELFSLLPPTQQAFNFLVSAGGANNLSQKQFIVLKKQMDYGTRRAIMKLYRNTPANDKRHHDIAKLFFQYDFPALIIWGEDDPYLPFKLAQQQSKAFPSAKIHILKNCGHWPYFEKPQEVNNLLTNFYKKTLSYQKSKNTSDNEIRFR
jgi:pimeloyl-ACP methyl ester carboxylesterase